MAYAALVSLKHKINRSVKCYHDLIMPELVKLGTILRKLDGTKNRSNRNAINALDAGIREEVWKLEDLLECQVLYPPHSICRCYYSHRSSSKQEIYELTETLKKLGEVYATEVYRKLSGEEEDDVVSAIEDLAGKNSKKVGLWDEVEKILNDLVDPQSGSKTVSIVGMAGIGKSHIASEIFHHPIIAQHFDLLVWVSVGPQKETKNVWLKVLGEVESKSKETNVIKAAGLLRERLRGRRHLTVLDDVWSRVECHSLIRLLHGNGTQGRVLITTRLEQVAKDLDSSIHHLRFLNNEESWDLLWHNVFGGKSAFPLQLEKSGRKIAEKCEGLPLLILAVAHILSQLDTTLEYWNKVAHDKTTTFPEAYDKIHKVLYSSFEYLPQYLKPCFLYMGVFPQTSEVPLSKLINLLTVEDFMEPELRLTPVMKTLKPREAQPMPTLQTLATALRGKSTLGSLASVPRTDGKSYAPKRGTKWHSTKLNSDKSILLSTCRDKRAFETLYLLEPGHSPIRFIAPFDKLHAFKKEPSLTRHLRRTDQYFYSPSHDCFDQTRSREDLIATSENFVMECVEKLVSNSLAIVCKHSSKSRIKSCKLHSAYWHLCVKEARKTKFFHVLKKLADASQDCIKRQRRLSVQNNVLFGIKEVHDSIALAHASTARSLLCTGEYHEYPVPLCLNLMLLKILDALSIRFYEFPKDVLELVRLRYLALTLNAQLPSSIWKLEYLQFMIVRQHHDIKLVKHPTCLPKKIWNMKQLRYLRIIGSNLPSPYFGATLTNLLTLYVNADSCNEHVLQGTPQLKRLGIRIELKPDDAVGTMSCFEHISVLDELETLKCVVVNPRFDSQVVIALPNHLSDLPWGLKKLSLNGLWYSWGCMNAIGLLPNLQVLKLRCSAFEGAMWETKVGEFQRLEFLLLEDIDLVHWTTVYDDDDGGDCSLHLRHLVIRSCYKLKEMPGRMTTLEKLEIVDCSPLIVANAQQIQRDTNSSVEVMIKSSWNL